MKLVYGQILFPICEPLTKLHNFLFSFQSPLMIVASCAHVCCLLQVIGTICILFALSPQLAPILGLLMLTVSVSVGKFVSSASFF